MATFTIHLFYFTSNIYYKKLFSKFRFKTIISKCSKINL